jgi:hypothetical protein
MADKADWCDANVKYLIDICKGEIKAGNRPLGLFTRTGWKNMASKYEEKTGLKQIKKQLKNKLDNTKKIILILQSSKILPLGLDGMR